MRKQKFQFHPDSHEFIEVRSSWKQKLVRLSVFILITACCAIFVHRYGQNPDINPKLHKLQKQNQQLISVYDSLNLKLESIEQFLTEMQIRDDSLYRRTIFEIDPIPQSVREVGTGGSNPFPLLLGFNSSELMISTRHELDKLELKADVQMNSFDVLQHKAIDRLALLAGKPSIHPIAVGTRYWISSGFGGRIDPYTKRWTAHKGLDIAALTGTPVYATGDGTVIRTKISRTGYGKEILLDHGFGYTSRYGHLNSILVHHGQKVMRGQQIGTLGSSGKSTGPHLHYEVRYNHKALNPYYFFSEDLLPEEYHEIVARANPVDN